MMVPWKRSQRRQQKPHLPPSLRSSPAKREEWLSKRWRVEQLIIVKPSKWLFTQGRCKWGRHHSQPFFFLLITRQENHLYMQTEGGVILVSIRPSYMINIKEVKEGAWMGARPRSHPNFRRHSQKLTNKMTPTTLITFIGPNCMQIYTMSLWTRRRSIPTLGVCVCCWGWTGGLAGTSSSPGLVTLMAFREQSI